MQKYGVATASFQAFNEIEDALDLVHQMDGDLVIKGGRKMGGAETILGWQRLGGAF